MKSLILRFPFKCSIIDTRRWCTIFFSFHLLSWYRARRKKYLHRNVRKEILFYFILLLLERIVSGLRGRRRLDSRRRQTPFSLPSSFFLLSLFPSTFLLLSILAESRLSRSCEYSNFRVTSLNAPRPRFLRRLKCEFCQARLIHNRHWVNRVTRVTFLPRTLFTWLINEQT